MHSKLPHRRAMVLALALAMAPIALATSALSAPLLPQTCSPDQLQVEGAPCFEAWVNPCFGSFNGSISNPSIAGSVRSAKDSPFATINGAIQALRNQAQGLNAQSPGIVHLMPGIYEIGAGGNQGSQPIQMQPLVHVVGAGARQCVIRGLGNLDNASIQLPFTSGPQFVNSQLLVEMPIGGGSYVEGISRVTFQGGDVQVRMSAEAFGNGRVSNCVFDMLDYSNTAVPTELSVPGPDFGVIMNHFFDEFGGSPDVEPGYWDLELSVINNTFIQAWTVRGPGTTPITSYCSDDAVAICDMNDPFVGQTPDEDTTIRGVGNPLIFNNLIHNAFGPGKAFLGIDYSDTGDGGQQSNIFDEGNNGDESSGGLYTVFLSQFMFGSPPSNAPFSGDAYAPFVGEMVAYLSSPSPSSPIHFGLEYLRDWRLLYEASAQGAGINPVNGSLLAENGTVYQDPSSIQNDCRLSSVDAFAFDGEGWGNPRIEGNQIDIGFDEIGELIVTGYHNDSILLTDTPKTSRICVPDQAVGRGQRLTLLPHSVGNSYTSRIKTKYPNENGAATVAPQPRSYSKMPGSAAFAVQLAGLNYYWVSPPKSMFGQTQPFGFTVSLASLTGYKPLLGDQATSYAFRYSFAETLSGKGYAAHQGKLGGNKLTNMQPAHD